MTDVADLLEVTDDNVRKWGTQLLFLQHPDAPVPASFFGTADHAPILPSDAIQLGFVTTDGCSNTKSLSSEPTTMLQKLRPVRRDMTGIEETMTVAFGEDNAYVQALYHGVPFEDFPADANAPWLFDDGLITEYPRYRLGVLMQDGIGSLARYRIEYGYRVTVTALADRTASRTAPETYGVTFGFEEDPILKKTLSRGQNGPAYFKEARATATVAAGVVTAVNVTSGGTRYSSAPTVVFGGPGTGATGTAVLTDGVVTGVTIGSGGTGYTTAPTVSFVRV